MFALGQKCTHAAQQKIIAICVVKSAQITGQHPAYRFRECYYRKRVSAAQDKCPMWAESRHYTKFRFAGLRLTTSLQSIPLRKMEVVSPSGVFKRERQGEKH